LGRYSTHFLPVNPYPEPDTAVCDTLTKNLLEDYDELSSFYRGFLGHLFNEVLGELRNQPAFQLLQSSSERAGFWRDLLGTGDFRQILYARVIVALKVLFTPYGNAAKC
jgi:hypothetical protein